MDTPETLYSLFEKTEKRPDIQKKPAVIFHDGATMHTMLYEDLIRFKGLVSNELLSYSFTHEIICCLVGPGLNLPALLLGILKLNSSFCFLSTTDPNRCLSNILDHTLVQTILVERKTAKLSKFYLCECWTIAKTFRVNRDYITLFQMILKHCNDSRHVGCRAISGLHVNSQRKLAYVIQTSGTTGTPKVVQVPHRCIVPNILHFRSLFDVTTADRIFMASPLTFDPSVVDMFVALTSGACLFLVPDHLKIMSRRLGEILINCNISILQITPSLLQSFGKDFLQKQLLRKGTKVRILALGGELCPSYEILETFKDPGNWRTKIFNLYGVTEVSCWAMCHEVDFWCANGEKEVPLGEPILNTQIQVRNEVGENIETGVGQLFVGSPERRCFINKKNWEPDDFLHPTGDWVCKTQNGKLYFRGRKDRTIKCQGRKIHLLQIEKTLDNIPEVERHAVVFKEKESSLSIFICIAPSCSKPEGDVKFGIGEILRQSISELPSFKLTAVPHIPLNTHGKVDYGKLIDHEENLLMKHHLHGSHTRLSIIKGLTDLWKQFTKVETVKNDANFVLNGGNSITALQLALEIENLFAFLNSKLVDVILNATFIDVLELLLEQLLGDGRPPKKLRKVLDEKQSLETFSCHLSQNRENSLCHKDATRRGLNTFCACTKCSDTYFVKISYTDPFFRNYFRHDFERCVDASPCLVHFLHSDMTVCYIGSHSRIFSAINLEQKKLLWTAELSGRIESSACIDECGQYVFVGCYGSYLYSFYAQTGKLHWKVQTGAEVKSSPVVSQSKVFVGSYDQHLYAIDIQSGTVVWKVQLSNGSIYSSPAVFENRVCAATLDGKVVMLDTEDGSVIWEYDHGKPFFSSPLFIMSHVFIASVDGCFLKLDSVGNPVMQMDLVGNTFSSPSVIGENCDSAESLKVVIGSQKSGLQCFSFSGKLLWTFPCSAPINCTPFVIPASDSVFYVIFADTKGVIHLVNAKDGEEVQSFTCPTRIFSSPVVVNDLLAIGCRDNFVHIFHF